MCTQLIKKASLCVTLCLVASTLLLSGCGSTNYKLAEGQKFHSNLAYISAMDSGGLDPFYVPYMILIDRHLLIESDERIENRVLYAFEPGKREIHVQYRSRDAFFSSSLTGAYPMFYGKIAVTHEWEAGKVYVAVPSLTRKSNRDIIGRNVLDSVVLDGTIRVLPDDTLNKICPAPPK